VAGRIPALPELDHDLRRLQAEYDIPIEVNDAVVAYVRFFQHPKVRKHFVRWLGRAPRYMPRFREILREEGLPEDTVFLAMIESGFASRATSRARAVGPWQFIAGTGKRMGLKQDFFVDERRDPEKAAHAAARYLRELHEQFGDWRLAWAGYNAGAGKIARAQRRGYGDFWAMTKGRRVLKRETQGYVPKLMAAAIVTKHPEAFGFGAEEIEAESWTPYELVTVPRATLLSAVAKAAEVPEHALLDLNPELRRTCTPPHAYALKVPRGQAETFAGNWERVAAESGKLAFAHHRVQRGETLAAVAQRYGVPAATVPGGRTGDPPRPAGPPRGGDCGRRAPRAGGAGAGGRPTQGASARHADLARPGGDRRADAGHRPGPGGRLSLGHLPALRRRAPGPLPLERHPQPAPPPTPSGRRTCRVFSGG
jgi:membrane-bound lytic murein transglycosylase D